MTGSEDQYYLRALPRTFCLTRSALKIVKPEVGVSSNMNYRWNGHCNPLYPSSLVWMRNSFPIPLELPWFSVEIDRRVYIPQSIVSWCSHRNRAGEQVEPVSSRRLQTARSHAPRERRAESEQQRACVCGWPVMTATNVFLEGFARIRTRAHVHSHSRFEIE